MCIRDSSPTACSRQAAGRNVFFVEGADTFPSSDLLTGAGLSLVLVFKSDGLKAVTCFGSIGINFDEPGVCRIIPSMFFFGNRTAECGSGFLAITSLVGALLKPGYDGKVMLLGCSQGVSADVP